MGISATVHGNKIWFIEIQGVTPEVLKKINSKTINGEYYTMILRKAKK